MLWAVFTIIAAAAQTARNAMQRELTATLGTVGATHVRFLFGFPFALVFLAGVLLVTGDSLPHPGPWYWPWIIDGLLAQIAATALMLAAMNDRSFVVTIAYIKTEPVQVALFGFVLLGDKVTPLLALAIIIATAGVVVMSLKPGAAQVGGWKPTLLGLDLRRHVRAVGDRLSRRHPAARGRQRFRGVGHLHAGGRPGAAVGSAVRLSCAARSRRAEGDLPRLAAVDLSPASWARSPRSSGSSPSPSPPRPACARWRWSKCCSRRRFPNSSSSSRPRRAKAIGIALVVIGVGLLVWAH